MLDSLIATPGLDLHLGQVTLDFGKDLSLQEFEALCRENPDLRLEQKSTGELVIVAPHGGESSYDSLEVGHQLKRWIEDCGIDAFAFDSNALFILPDGAKLSSDASIVSGANWKKLTKKQRQGFMPAVPDFIVEVRSPSDRLPILKGKMRDWMSNGVALGWLLDVAAQKAWVYQGDTSTEVELGKFLDGSGPVAGFRLSIDKLTKALE